MSKIAKSVNDVYAERNPSTYAKNPKDLRQLIIDRKSFLLKLKLPPQIFKNTTLIDFGCGTGQNTILYDNLGSNCTLLEYDKHSFEECSKLFKKYAKNKYQIHNTDIFKYKINSKKFDFVVSNGVAHHTENPKKNIEICCKATKKGGFFILGIGNKAGFFQRNLQRLILYKICKNKEEIIKFSKILFRENLNRAIKYSGRSMDEIIYDTYLNPKIETFSTKEIMSIFNKNKISLYSSFQNEKNIIDFFEPNVKQFRIKNKLKFKSQDSKKNIYLSDFQDLTLSNNKISNHNIYNQLKETSLSLDKLTERVNNLNFEYKNLSLSLLLKDIIEYKKQLLKIQKIDILDKKHNKIFLNELSKIIGILNTNKKIDDKLENVRYLILKTEKLFKLFNGVGMNFYCGYKN